MATVNMVYDTMRAMTKEFQDASGRFDDNISAMNLISGLVDGGALVGKGGQKFLEYLEDGLLPFAKQLQLKMDELAGDVNGARAAMEDGDSTAASRFSA